MSTEQNKAIVSRIWQEIFNEGKLDLIDELYDKGYIYHGPGGHELKGLEGLKRYRKELSRFFPDLRFSLGNMIAEGEQVALHWTMRGTYAPRKKQMTLSGIIISRIVDGKCLEDWEIFDRLSLAQQGAPGIQKSLVNLIIKGMKKEATFLSISS
jgi:predicted SnoaL-like aldol condensation-catalyzing enzyme